MTGGIELAALESLPLAAMVNRLLVATERSGWTMRGDVAAYLARRLVASEAAVGGPYRDEAGIIDPALNRSIALLMRALKSPLPNVEMYVCSVAPIRLSSARARLTPIQRATRDRIMQYARPLRTTLLEAFSSIVNGDAAGEISQLSTMFAASLMAKPRRSMEEALGVANMLTWIAYSIYDDFIDDEGVAKALPAANVAHREALALYKTALPANAMVNPDNLFKGMDEANAWEVAACRFTVVDTVITIGALPRYGRLAMLAARSRAHVLGPLIMMNDAGFPPDQSRRAACALDDYLIARQIGDDLHDWADDLARGHISPVVAGLLRAASVGPGDYELSQLTATLKQTFWQTGLTEWSDHGLRMITRAERELVASDVLIAESPFITNVLRPLRDILQRGLARHAEDERFLATYSRSLPRAKRPK